MNASLSRRRRFLFYCLGWASAGLNNALAHAKLIRSYPKEEAKLQDAPKTIDLWFNELLDDEFNTVQLFRAADLGQVARKGVCSDKPKVDPKDRTHLMLHLPQLVPDTYAVEYRVLSRDGHIAASRYTFTLLPPTK